MTHHHSRVNLVPERLRCLAEFFNVVLPQNKLIHYQPFTRYVEYRPHFRQGVVN